MNCQLSSRKKEVMQKDTTCEYLFTKPNDYISTIKHDFTIPVIAQIRALELLSCETLGNLNFEQKEIVKTTLESCRTLYDMMSNILYSNELRNKKVRLCKTQTDIIKLTKECLISENNKYLQKHIHIKVLESEKSYNIKCDKDKIKTAFEYIFGYCFSAVSDKGFLIYDIKCDKKNVIMKIIFKSPFLYNDTLNKIGSNLKLNLAKNITELHNGKISIKKEQTLTTVNICLKN